MAKRGGTVITFHAPLPRPGRSPLREAVAYGFRVRDPYEPAQGLRCNPSKLLVDPYARAIRGALEWNEAVFGYRFGDPDGPRSELDSAPYVPKAVVVNPYFDWGNDRPPRIPWQDTR